MTQEDLARLWTAIVAFADTHPLVTWIVVTSVLNGVVRAWPRVQHTLPGRLFGGLCLALGVDPLGGASGSGGTGGGSGSGGTGGAGPGPSGAPFRYGINYGHLNGKWGDAEDSTLASRAGGEGATPPE